MSFNPDHLIDAVTDSLSNDRDQIESIHHSLSSYSTNRVSLAGPFGLANAVSNCHPSNNQSAMSAAAAAAILIQAAASGSGNDLSNNNGTNQPIPGRRCSTASLFESPQPSPSMISAAAQQALAAAHVIASPHSPSGSSAGPSFQAAVLSLALAASSTCTTTTSNASGVNEYHQRSAMSDLISLSEQHPELLTAHSTLASVFRRRPSTLAPPYFTNAINLSCTDTSGSTSTQNETNDADIKQQSTMFMLPNSISNSMHNCSLQFQNNQPHLMLTDYHDEMMSGTNQLDSSISSLHKSSFTSYGFRNFDQHHDDSNNNSNNNNRHSTHHPLSQQQQPHPQHSYYSSMSTQPSESICVKSADQHQRSHLTPHLQQQQGQQQQQQHQYQMNLDEAESNKIRTVITGNLGSSIHQPTFDDQSVGFFKGSPKLDSITHQQQQQHSMGSQSNNILHQTFDRQMLSSSTPNNSTISNKLNNRYFSPVTVPSSNDLMPSFGCASSPLSCSSSLSNAATTPTVNVETRLKLSNMDDTSTAGIPTNKSSSVSDKSGRNTSCLMDDGSTVGEVCGRADEPTRKREQRLMKNREAARECRRKKKEYVKCLEARVSLLESQNQQLIEELRKVKAIRFKDLCGLGLNNCAAAVLAAVTSVSVAGGGGTGSTSPSETTNSFPNDSVEHRDLRPVASEFSDPEPNNQVLSTDDHSRPIRRRRRSVFNLAASMPSTTKMSSYVPHQTSVPSWLGPYNMRSNTTSPNLLACQPANNSMCSQKLTDPTKLTNSLDYITTQSVVHSPHLSVFDNVQMVQSNKPNSSVCPGSHLANNQSQDQNHLSQPITVQTTQTSTGANSHQQHQSWKSASYLTNSLTNNDVNSSEGHPSSTENTENRSIGMYHHPRYAVKRAYRNMQYTSISPSSSTAAAVVTPAVAPTVSANLNSTITIVPSSSPLTHDLLDDNRVEEGDEDEEEEEENIGLNEDQLTAKSNNHQTSEVNSVAEAAAILAATAAATIATKCDSSAPPEMSKLSV